MDVVFSNVLQDLNNFQSKIASLFQDLIKEKVYYRENLKDLYKNLREASSETEKLKKEIEVLREDNLNMRNIIYKGISLFENLDFTKTITQHINELEALKATFLDYSTKMENSNLTDSLSNKENKSVCKERFELTEEEIQKEIESLKSINFSTNLFNDDMTEKSTDKEFTLQRSSSQQARKSCLEIKQNEDKVQSANEATKEPVLVCRSKSFGLDFINSTVCSDSGKVETLTENNKSPVFKDFSGRRHYGNSSSSEENGNENSSWESRTTRLINEKFLEKTINLDLSSPEKSPCQDKKDSQSCKSPASNWINNSFKIPNFRIARNNILKKSYTREVENSPLGMKILTQTFLNVDCFKRKTPEKVKRFDGEENENRVRPSVKFRKKTSEEDIEDVEVPNKDDEVLKDTNNKKTSGQEVEEIPFMSPPLNTEPDLDETYISYSIVRKHMLEREIGDQTPLKRYALERNPERDFPYKDKPVRKRAERMKLPGHTCVECKKYYENALGDISEEELKKILNKCSRHRERYSPSLDDTPPGYWKPYLTGSTIISPDS